MVLSLRWYKHHNTADDRISSVCKALYIVFLHTHTHANRGSLYLTYVRVQNEGVDFGKKTLFKFTAARRIL